MKFCKISQLSCDLIDTQCAARHRLLLRVRPTQPALSPHLTRFLIIVFTTPASQLSIIIPHCDVLLRFVINTAMMPGRTNKLNQLYCVSSSACDHSQREREVAEECILDLVNFHWSGVRRLVGPPPHLARSSH